MMKKHILRVLAMSLALTLLLTSSGLALTLRYPQRGNDVTSLQTALSRLGYYSNTIDGVYGNGTINAVKAFQKNYGLTVDGVAGPATLAKIAALTGIQIGDTSSSGGSSGDADLPANEDGLFGGNYATIQFGAEGDRVRILQRALLALGFEVGKVDGDFGSGTYKAVKQFQETVQLTADGKAGKKTLQKIETYFDEKGNCISSPLNTPAPSDPDENLEYDVPTRTLRFGMSGLDVQYTQQRLYTLGYYTGTMDGQFGSGMLKALNAFQEKNGLEADGVLGAASRKVLFSTGAIGTDETVEEPETHRTLRFGMQGDDVAAVQQRLKELGYYTSTIDGQFGSGMLKAVKAFQARNGLTADGVCGPDTTEKIYSADAIDAGSSVATPTPTPTPTPTQKPTDTPAETLQFGDQGDAVKALQKRLAELGYYTSTIDGVYGNGTYNAVKFFQARNALTVDGKAGATTLAKLYSDDAINAEDGTTEEVTPTPTPMATPSRTLRYGHTGEDVKLLQSRLIDLGYLKTAANSTFDQNTLTAVKAFQLANGLTADGVAGTKTYKKLFSDSAIEAPVDPDTGDTDLIPDRTLTTGSTGDDVKSVQQRLKDLKYLTSSVDGQYGSMTAAAMKAFQEMNGLTATGNGNLATYAKLYSDDAINAEGVKQGQSAPAYTNLTFGSSGTAVIRLQQKLAAYKYTVTVTGSFDEQTYAAVLAFQKRNGLGADGIAGKNTQTKLYSGSCVTGDTVLPEEDDSITGDTGNGGGPAISQVKWLMWHEEIKPNLKSGATLLVYEPSSNSSFYLKVYSRGNHCDSEPLTAADTATMKAAWGGFSWDEKPVYVRLPSGVWCIASMHSMPHLSGSISNNDFDGHLCVHFPRTLEETIAAGDVKNGVRHQNDIRKHWKLITGEDITW